MIGYIFEVIEDFESAFTMFNRVVFAGGLTLALLGCSSTGVIPVDRDSYMIGKKDGSPGLGVSLSTKADVYREANAFCMSKGLEVETLNLSVTPAALARLGSTELRFKCVPKGADTAKPHVRESDQILEIRTR
jgi:hypothetical protein